MSSKLSARLLSLLHMIEQGRGETLWDIGCDHGLLGLTAPEVCPWLKAVHFVDPSEPVIIQLRKAIDAHIPSSSFNLRIHHTAGEKLTIPTPNNVFVIAGMGGKMAMTILEHLRPQGGERDQFIISPNRDILQVRARLLAQGWGLHSECLIEENGQYFQQLALRPSGGARKVSPYGEDFWQSPLGEKYRAHLLEKLSVHRDEQSQAFLAFLRS